MTITITEDELEVIRKGLVWYVKHEAMTEGYGFRNANNIVLVYKLDKKLCAQSNEQLREP